MTTAPNAPAASIYEPLSSAQIENRMIAAMRLILASAALLINFIDPSGARPHTSAVFAVLVSYLLYCVCLYALMWQGKVFAAIKYAHWIDIAWFTALIALSGGANSIFFFFLFFSILIAAFSDGFAAGFGAALVSALLFTLVGGVNFIVTSEVELNRFLLRPIYLIVLGYMAAYWGGAEVKQKRRLSLLREINRLSNPRFGVDHTIGSIMDRLRDFYAADTCLWMSVTEPNSDSYTLRRADTGTATGGRTTEALPKEMARLLLALPAACAAIYRKGAYGSAWNKFYYACDTLTGERLMNERECVEALAATLDAGSLITVPLRQHSGVLGRVYLFSKSRCVYDNADINFLLQVFENVMPTLENIRLVDRLASDAADQERQRIARDIHDSVIQPYIGLRLGLAAIEQKLAADSAVNVTNSVEELRQLADEEIQRLRRYVGRLKGETATAESNFLPAVRRFVTKFSEATGISVRVEADSEVCINDRLAAEAFQMVAEGLSNIRRHTESSRATISVACLDNQFTLRIENDDTSNGAVAGSGVAVAPVPSFIPRSLSDRAASLGGQALVERGAGGGAIIDISIPL